MEQGNKPIIMAVDDKPELLSTIVGVLKPFYMVIGATSSLAALKMIKSHSPDLFILDIEMPLMNGFELAETLREHKKFEHTPIIFLTGRNTREDVITAISRGGNDYIVKPVDKKMLITKIRNQLER